MAKFSVQFEGLIIDKRLDLKLLYDLPRQQFVRSQLIVQHTLLLGLFPSRIRVL